MPLVSVIMPYYKKINFVINAINSVLNQSYQNFELILVYDDTNLSDLEIIKNEFKNNPKLKIIKNNKNFGAGISRNIGISQAIGEIIAFIDSDDYWFKEKLERQLNFMNHNNLDFTFCNYKKKISTKKSITIISSKNKFDYNDLIKSCDIGLSTVLIRKKIIEEELFPNLKTKEDYVAWLKILKKGVCAHNLNETLVIWNSVKDSLSSNFFQKILDGFRVYYNYEKFSFFKSLFCLLILSLNSIKKKV